MRSVAQSSFSTPRSQSRLIFRETSLWKVHIRLPRCKNIWAGVSQLATSQQPWHFFSSSRSCSQDRITRCTVSNLTTTALVCSDAALIIVTDIAQSGKPLLARIDDEETIRGDSDQDIESQRSYDTFGRCVSNDGSTTSSSTRSRINPRIISDAILGLSDGLTVPFALSAGLSALGNTKVVVLGGLAELAAGAISMGLGGYVGAKSEA